MTTPSSHSTGSGASATSNQVSEILARVSITEVWHALGGGPLRHGRAAAFWRQTRDLNVSLNDSKNCWYDFRDSIGGGILDLIQHVREGDRKAALHWLADYYKIPLVDRPLADSERRDLARRREADKRDLLAARWFGRAVATVVEEVLEALPWYHLERMGLTQLLRAVGTDGGALATYRAWGPRRRLVRALVAAGRASDATAQRKLAQLLMEGIGDAEVT